MHKTVKKLSDVIFRDITSLCGSFFFVLLILLTLALSMQLLALKLIFGFILAWLVIIIVRLIYFRNRPKKESHSNVFERIDASSFPSMHATRATFLAALLITTFPGTSLAVLFLVIALLIIYSRIYLKKHDWWDISAGAILGLVIFWITTLF